jgi:hypothetical protein
MNFQSVKNSLYFIRQGMKIDPVYNFEMQTKHIVFVITCKVLSYLLYGWIAYHICKWIFE